MTTITITENDLTRYDQHERTIFRAAADVGIVGGIGKLDAAGHPARREAIAGAVDAHRKRIPAELRIGMKARAKGLPERLHKLCAWLIAEGPASEAPTLTIDDLDARPPVQHTAMTAAEKVAKARAYVDAGELDAGAALVLELAIADRDGDIGYVERMRWHETVGALDRAGFDLRAYFVAHGATPPQVGPLVPPPAVKPGSVLPTATTPTVPAPAPEDPEHYLFVRFHVRTPDVDAVTHELEELVADGTLAEALMTACGWKGVSALVIGVEQGASEPAGKPPTDPTPTPEPTPPKAKRTKRAAKAAKVAAPLPFDTVGAECDADIDRGTPVNEPTPEVPAIQAPEAKRPAMTAKATKTPAPEKLRKSVHKYVADRIGEGSRIAIDLGKVTVGVHGHACIFAGVSSPQAPELSWDTDSTKLDSLTPEARMYLRSIRERIAEVPKRTLAEPLVVPAGELPRDEEKRAAWLERTQARIDKLHRISIGAGTRLTSDEKQKLRDLRRAVRKLDATEAHTYKHAPFDARLIEAARKALLVPAGEQGAMSWAVGTHKPAWIQWSTGGVLIMPLFD